MCYLDIIYVADIQLCCKKSYSDLKMVNFSVLKIGFHGDTFVAREHSINGKFQFSIKV